MSVCLENRVATYMCTVDCLSMFMQSLMLIKSNAFIKMRLRGGGGMGWEDGVGGRGGRGRGEGVSWRASL